MFMSSEEFWAKIVLIGILLRVSSKLVFSMIMVQEGLSDVPRDITLFQYNLKNYSSAVYHDSG